MGIIAIRDLPIIKSLFPKNKTTSQRSFKEIILSDGYEAKYKNYALNLCISRISNALQLCDFQTLYKGERFKGPIWYRLNYQPNINQNKSDFIYKIIYKMVYDCNGALVIQDDKGDFIVADNYEVTEYAFYENIYSNIELPGGYHLKRDLKESDVLHFVLNNNEIKKIVDGIYDDYSKLITGTIKNYNRNNSLKFKLKMDAQFDNFKDKTVLDDDGEPLKREDGSIVTEYDDILDDFMLNRYKGLLSEKDSVTPFESGLDLDPIMNQKGNTKSGAATTRDITDTFKDIVYMVADAFAIPRAYILGDVADGEVVKSNFIDDAVRPVANIFELEINRKIYKFEGLKSGSKLKIKTNFITTKDPIKFANAAEALLRTGIYTINDLLEMIGEERINEEWANKRFITKNYQTFEELEKAIKTNVDNLLRERSFIHA